MNLYQTFDQNRNNLAAAGGHLSSLTAAARRLANAHERDLRRHTAEQHRVGKPSARDRLKADKKKTLDKIAAALDSYVTAMNRNNDLLQQLVDTGKANSAAVATSIDTLGQTVATQLASLPSNFGPVLANVLQSDKDTVSSGELQDLDGDDDDGGDGDS